MSPSHVPPKSEAPSFTDSDRDTFIQNVLSNAELHFPEGGFSRGELVRISQRLKTRIILQTIKQCKGNCKKAARFLGISYRSLLSYKK